MIAFIKGGLLNLLRNFVTDADGDFCVTTAVTMVGVAALTYRFCTVLPPNVDWMGYAGGIAALAAIVAGKRYSERH